MALLPPCASAEASADAGASAALLGVSRSRLRRTAANQEVVQVSARFTCNKQ